MRKLAVSLLLVSGVTVAAQTPRFMYPAPAAGAVNVTMNVPYGDGLQMDVYSPAAGSGRRPVVVFFNIATGASRSNPFYKAFAEIAASNGIVAVLPDLTFEQNAREFDALLAHLASDGEALGIDGGAVAVFAGSGNVSRALPLVQDPARTTVAAAVMHYGSADVAVFRMDLPVLFVRAGLDRPSLNTAITALVARASDSNAPVSLLNYSAGHHAFEIVDDSIATRDVIDQTLAFVRTATSPERRAALRRGVTAATAAGHVTAGRFGEAAAIYAEMVAARADDARLRLAYGEALLGDGQFAAACGEFAKLKGAPLGARDLGLPAARSCLQAGDADAAVAWLAGIPARFRPASLATDPAWTALRDHPGFRALLESRD